MIFWEKETIYKKSACDQVLIQYVTLTLTNFIQILYNLYFGLYSEKRSIFFLLQTWSC